MRSGGGPVGGGRADRAEIFSDVANKWAFLIVEGLGDRTLRFSELRNEIEGISHKMLTQNLRHAGAQRPCRSDAPYSADLLFCHVYSRAKSASPFIPGWPYSFVAVLEPAATSWTSVLDVVRLGPEDDASAVIAAQLRAVAERLISVGQWAPGDPEWLQQPDAARVHQRRPPQALGGKPPGMRGEDGDFVKAFIDDLQVSYEYGDIAGNTWWHEIAYQTPFVNGGVRC